MIAHPTRTVFCQHFSGMFSFYVFEGYIYIYTYIVSLTLSINDIFRVSVYIYIYYIL